MTAFTADDLIDCYRMGVFPMGESRQDRRVMIVEPRLRGVLDLDRFHLPRRLARQIRQDVFTVTADTAFREVVAACAAETPGRSDTWINEPIESLYAQLFERGVAHSLEARRDGELVGGLYGVALGGAFFGESMFSRHTGASKVALAHLVARLKAGGYDLLDCQFQTPHLAQFGVTEISQEAYLAKLETALMLKGDFSAIGRSVGGQAALHAISQAS